MKINLQRFAGLVDYMNSKGMTSDYATRKRMAQEMGIQNYSGTAEQNTAMLNALKSGSDTATVTSSASSVKSTASPTKTNTAPAQASGSAAPVAQNSVLHGVNQSLMDTMNKQFQASDAYNQAMQYTNGLLEQLSSGRTKYTDQLDQMFQAIQSREKFQYDMDTDPLFQNMLHSSINTGKMAMQDTMGQAAALTGGYGSSYATSAANQAYNAYIQDAYNNLPEYYNLALEAYEREGAEMYKQLSVLGDFDARDYDRLANAYSANASAAQTMYGNEYTAWADEVNNAFKQADMLNSDYWQNANFNESIRQFNANYALKQQEMANDVSYKNASLALQREKNESGNGNGNGDVTYKEPSETQKKKALEAYNTGGEDALMQYVDSLPSNIDVQFISDYIDEYGNLPLMYRTYEKVKDTPNYPTMLFNPGIDHNDVVQDQFGNTYKIDDLPKEIRQALTDLKFKEKYTYSSR